MRIVAAGIAVALGLAACGWLVGDGLMRLRAADRAVTVKGVAERAVRADLVVWPLAVTVPGSDLAATAARADADLAIVRAFLVEAGVPEAAIRIDRPQVFDTEAQAYGGDQPRAQRYIVSRQLIVRTDQVDLIERLGGQIGDLVSRGVALGGNPYGGGADGPSYLFTQLNAVKPEMLAEATASAREAADQFARDSGSRLGAIADASQGLFQVQPRDPIVNQAESAQADKLLRVVVTVTYRLVE